MKATIMFNLKKYFTDELLQVALILSLLRIDRRSLEYNVPVIGIGTNNLTSTWDQSNILVRREGSIHPKSIDSILLNYEQEVFHELNSLGRYGRIFESLSSRNLTAFLLNVDEPPVPEEGDDEAASSEPPADSSGSGADTRSSLRREVRRKNVDSDQLSPEVSTIFFFQPTFAVENVRLFVCFVGTGMRNTMSSAIKN